MARLRACILLLQVILFITQPRETASNTVEPSDPEPINETLDEDLEIAEIERPTNETEVITQNNHTTIAEARGETSPQTTTEAEATTKPPTTTEAEATTKPPRTTEAEATTKPPRTTETTTKPPRTTEIPSTMKPTTERIVTVTNPTDNSNGALTFKPQVPTEVVTQLSQEVPQQSLMSPIGRKVLIAFGICACFLAAIFIACYLSRRRRHRHHFQRLQVDEDLLNYESGIHTMTMSDPLEEGVDQTSFNDGDDSDDNQIIYQDGALTTNTTFRFLKHDRE